jgi:hypothetical protein
VVLVQEETCLNWGDEGWERDDSVRRIVVLPGDLAGRLAAEAGRRGISLNDLLSSPMARTGKGPAAC